MKVKRVEIEFESSKTFLIQTVICKLGINDSTSIFMRLCTSANLPRARGRLALGTGQIGLWEIACEDAGAYRFSLKGIMHVKDTRKRPQYSLLNHTIVFSSRKYYVVSVLWTPKCFYEGSFRLWLETLFIHLKYTFLMSPSCFLFYFVSFRYSPSREYAKINT